MLFAMRLPRTEVTLVCYKREQCRLSVKRRRSSQNSAGCANKTARLYPASVPVRRGLKCVERAEYMGCIVVWEWRACVPVRRGLECVERAKGNYICERKKETGIKPSLLIFCYYSLDASSPAFAAASDTPASAAGASAFASASATGAAAVSSSTTDCCTNCNFSSAVRI